MHELRLANGPVPRSVPESAAQRLLPLSRVAVVVSVLAHVVGGYVASQWSWTREPPVTPAPTTEFWFVPPPVRRAVAPEPAVVVEQPVSGDVQVAPAIGAPPPAVPATREAVPAPRPAPAVLEPRDTAVGASPVSEQQPQQSPLVPRITPLELEEVRQRAAAAVVEQRSIEDEFLTFSVDDVAPPRPAPEEERRSIFDGAGGAGVSRTTVGQQRTRIGRRVAELCNALTGGFSIMGLGNFCGEADDEPSGLFPEVRPEILDLMPECVETRPLAEQLGEESEFPTVKCELVPKKPLPERWELP